MKSPKNLWIALAVVAVWLAITIGGGHLQGGGHTELDELVKRRALGAGSRARVPRRDEVALALA